MTREQFFQWAEAREGRWEFDGFQPVAMTGGTLDHSQIGASLLVALAVRLKGSGCGPLGSDAGVATIDGAVRYPDALVTCAKAPGASRLAPGVVVVFEVVSPPSARVDRIDKLREYAAVPSILRYVILEQTSVGMSVFERRQGDAPWTATSLVEGETLRMPEIGIEVQVDEFYAGVELTEDPG